jgi:hypothetical protein
MNNVHRIMRGVLSRASLCAIVFSTTAAPCFAQASNQSRERLELRVTAQPGEAVPLQIPPPGVGGRKFSLVVIRGLSDKEKLEPGIKSKDAWYVPIKDLSALKLTMSAESKRDLIVSASFVEEGNATQVVRIFTLHVDLSSKQIDLRPKQDATSATAAKSAPSVASPSVSAEEEQKTLAEGGQLMKNGDIAAARLLFEDLAIQGSAKGAFAMGQSYDPKVLAGLAVQGLAPDPEKARQWYEKARQLKFISDTPK